MRECRTCHKNLPETSDFFYKDKRYTPGWLHACKKCHQAKLLKANDPEGQEHRNKWRRDWQRKLRIEVLTHYSGGTPNCACCGVQHYEFLALDHTNGNGNAERRRLGLNGGQPIYSYVKKHGYPEGFRVLCHNCNLSFGFYGHCPHTTKSANLLEI